MTRTLIVTIFALITTQASAQTSLLPTVERIRSEYPTPMSAAQKGEMLNRVAFEHRAQGWGLLAKSGGSRCPSPQGVDISCDILVHAPSAWIFDVLVDQDFAATPAWIDKGPCDSGCPLFVAPIGTAVAPTSSGDVPAPGDYDGDGQIDVAVFRTSTGEWLIAQSTAGVQRVLWGAPGDVPMPADYDGDRKTDIAIFRPATAEWFVLNSSTGMPTRTVFGFPSGAGSRDMPMAGDYDRDGRADLGIYRATTGDWFVLRTSDGGTTHIQWGAP
jgi:FG-GAP-like repeat